MCLLLQVREKYMLMCFRFVVAGHSAQKPHTNKIYAVFFFNLSHSWVLFGVETQGDFL